MPPRGYFALNRWWFNGADGSGLVFCTGLSLIGPWSVCLFGLGLGWAWPVYCFGQSWILIRIVCYVCDIDLFFGFNDFIIGYFIGVISYLLISDRFESVPDSSIDGVAALAGIIWFFHFSVSSDPMTELILFILAAWWPMRKSFWVIFPDGKLTEEKNFLSYIPWRLDDRWTRVFSSWF